MSEPTTRIYTELLAQLKPGDRVVSKTWHFNSHEARPHVAIRTVDIIKGDTAFWREGGCDRLQYYSSESGAHEYRIATEADEQEYQTQQFIDAKQNELRAAQERVNVLRAELEALTTT